MSGWLICFIDCDRAIILVVERKTEDGSPQIAAIGRLSKLHGRDEAELAVLVDDRFQHHGMGTELYRRLIAIARDEKVHHVVSTILNENRDMRAICKGLGFQMRADMEDGTIPADLEL
jgi:acetyltransferase